ncbi:M23 family metallopeptidase [Parendozoicomonas sp. Alg238-R29]|uniref:M23 family metallopeptidase n=1 Tax=Parendozoicomonas sp. Alg238-R29 TaxID=2993446 RepID=UPI00248E77EF|nr:M23 family metallopeptidase [Parendozoicomonas sp. Alg238-R29]
MTWTGRLLMTLLSLPTTCFSDRDPVDNHSSNPLTSQQLKSGEALLLSLPCPSDKCTVAFDGNDIAVHPHPKNPGQSLVVIATPLDTTVSAKRKLVTMTMPDGGNLPSIELETIEPDYPVEPLSVNPDLVTPPEHALERINKERTEIANALKAKNPHQPLTSGFIEPVPLRKVTSPFGIRRLYNEQLKGRHTGVDLRAAEGTPVQAPHDGKVKMAQSNWYTGGHIVLEHGWGVSSSYFHLSDIQVNVGDTVSQGQKIALTGASGRVTGPHLHWGIHVNGTPVNPLQFMADSTLLFSP